MRVGARLSALVLCDPCDRDPCDFVKLFSSSGALQMGPSQGPPGILRSIPPGALRLLSPDAPGARAYRGRQVPRFIITAAFGRRCIPRGCVAPPSNTPGILGRRALPRGRLVALGASP